MRHAPCGPHLERLLAEEAGGRFYTAQRELGSARARAGDPRPEPFLFVGDTPEQAGAGPTRSGWRACCGPAIPAGARAHTGRAT